MDRIVELLVMPGLLQTADYARAVMTVHDVGAEKAQRFVRSAGAPAGAGPAGPAGAVVHRRRVRAAAGIGGRAVMRAQLEHLLNVAARPHVAVRVILSRWASTSACAGRSSCCASPGTNDPDVVYIEQRRGDAIFRNEIE